MRMILIALVAINVGAQERPKINLGVLSDCTAMKAISEHLNAPVNSQCRNAETSVEYKFVAAQGSDPDSQVCLLPSTSSVNLRGFSCIDRTVPHYREMICFRPVADSTINDYTARYDSDYKAAEYSYLGKASSCASTNQSASTADPSLFPFSLAVLAKPEIGFVAGVGQGLTPRGRAYHGFAEVDPAAGTGVRVLEVFDMFKADSSVSLGDLHESIPKGVTLGIEDTKEAERSLERSLSQQANVSMAVRLRIIHITAGADRKISENQRRADLSAWQTGLAGLLEKNGYRELSEERRRQIPGLNGGDPREFYIENSPYGYRDHLRRVMAPHIAFLVDDHSQNCGSLVELMVMWPEPGINSDYGGLTIYAAGGGYCGSGEHLQQIVDTSTRFIEGQVAKK